jgi:hypothetical protein
MVAAEAAGAAAVVDVVAVAGAAADRGSAHLGGWVRWRFLWQSDHARQYNLKRTNRRASLLVSRLLANMGTAGATPVLERFSARVAAAAPAATPRDS